jgi:hypothetical protein
MRIEQFRVVAVAALVVVASSLVGCAGQSEAAPAPAPSQAATAAPEPTPEAAVGPERLFDGDCDRLFDLDELGAAMGAPVVVQATEWDLDPEYTAPAQLGGLSCHWASTETEDAFLGLVVLPATAAGGASENECTPQYGCLFSAVAGEFALFGVLYDPAATVDEARAAYESLSATFAARVSGEPQPAAYTVDGAWTTPLDCAAVDTRGAVAEAVGAPAAAFTPWGGDSEPNSGYYRAAEAASTGLCGLDGAEEPVRLWVQGGGSWIEEEVAAASGATPVIVAGASAAYIVGDRLHVFSDADRFTLVAPGQSVDALLPGAGELLRDLDALG